MKTIYTENYEMMSRAGALVMLNTIKQKDNANLCLATGGSPTRMYEIFVEEVKQQQLDLSQVYFTKLDDWCGLSKQDEATCEYFIEKHLLKPLNISKDQVISFDIEATDLEAEALRIKESIQNCPLDLCILGLGMNGHLGLNEPADYLIPYAHTIALSEKTKTHSMLKGKKVEFGITLGMSELMQSSKILMLITGEKKQEAYEAFRSQQVTTQVPASFLWLHQDVALILDQSAFPLTK